MSKKHSARKLALDLIEYGSGFSDGPGMFFEAAQKLREQDRLIKRLTEFGREACSHISGDNWEFGEEYREKLDKILGIAPVVEDPNEPTDEE